MTEQDKPQGQPPAPPTSPARSSRWMRRALVLVLLGSAVAIWLPRGNRALHSIPPRFLEPEPKARHLRAPPPEVAGGALVGRDAKPSGDTVAPAGVTYTNLFVPDVPWSVHVARVARPSAPLAIQTVHARGAAVGLGTVSAQAALALKSLGAPVVAINGDFYQRSRAFAGRPRGLQISDSETLTAPNGGAVFWIDAQGEPRADHVESRFEVTWPDGSVSPMGLNEEREPGETVLYTPTLGGSTRTSGGRELILERADDAPWLPLRMGRTYAARVREIRARGNSPLERGTLVLSLGPAARAGKAAVGVGDVLKLSTGSTPSLLGATAAMGGGPLLLRGGRTQPIPAGMFSGYEYRSMGERHPRTAFGWNREAFFLVEVDGRQYGLSVGMTLTELAEFMRRLGCEEAINLDGGGSATFWYNGQVRNSPCGGGERPVANALVVVRREPGRSANGAPPEPVGMASN